MSIKIIVSAILFCLLAYQIRAGDAVAVGYNSAGIWTAITYNRSSTPKGGPHYHDAKQAGIYAVHDLQRRASEGLARTKIIGQSDQTGYVTVARGKIGDASVDVTAIGRGKSSAEADTNAYRKLRDSSATENATIVYRYFSYGDDFPLPSPAKTRSTQTSKASSAGNKLLTAP